MIGWNFPSNNFGQVHGLNNAGIETFKNNPFESLSREIAQNSCDAKLSDVAQPVEVHFTLHHISGEKVPGWNEMAAILEACREYWKDNIKAKKFFDKAIEVHSKATVQILKISDYNTTGLLGSDLEKQSDWFNLIKAAGASDKGKGAGGSYGIGKHAPFACSDLRTVFYSTLDCKGKSACQGVATLVTHQNGSDDETQGTGYFGITERNKPITDLDLIDPFFRREKVGTDVFIIGFSGGKEWETGIIKAVLEHFFVAIHEQTLVVRIGDTNINKNTLSALLEKYLSKDSSCRAHQYYSALTSYETQHHFSDDDFEGLGRVELFIETNKNYCKRVALVRSTGMKIDDKGNFSSPIKFAGVFIARGEELNDLLRAMEPPSHNKWEPERYEENKTYAKSIVAKLNKWINDKVRSLLPQDDSEQCDVEGISQYLPDEFEDIPMNDNSNESNEGVPNEPSIADIRTVPDSPATDVSPGQEVEGVPSENEGSELTDGDEDNQADGGRQAGITGGGAGDDDGTGGSIAGDDGKVFGHKQHQIKLKDLRVFCTDDERGVYRVLFTPTAGGQGFIVLNIAGEEESEPAIIRSARNVTSSTGIQVVSGYRIGPVCFNANEKTALEVELKDPIRCALEVSTNAN